MNSSTLNNIAVFIDFENLSHASFNTKHLIDKLKERGRLIVKKAYADWGRFAKAKHQMLENSVELIELPSHSQSKNQADIKLVVDALETAITKDYIDTFVVVSGDSDFTPLISKLREYNKYVIVVGVKKQVSKLLIGYCDELIYYSNLVGESTIEESDIKAAYNLLARAINYLEEQGVETRSSQIKSYMKQVDSSFNKSNYGFSQFKRFLEKAKREGLVSLKLLEHGDYLVKWVSKDFEPNDTAPQLLKPIEQEDILYLIAWAIKINQFGDQTSFTLSVIGSTIKSQLDPAFELHKYGYSKSQGFKAVVEDIAKQGYIKIEFIREKNQYYIRAEPKLEEYVQSTSPPGNFQQLRCENMCSKLGLTSNLELIDIFVTEVTSVIAEYHSKLEALTLDPLIEIGRQRIKDRDSHINVSEKVVNTVLKSLAIKDENDMPIIERDDERQVHRIESVDIVLNSCTEMIQDELKAHFSEDIELDLFNILLDHFVRDELEL